MAHPNIEFRTNTVVDEVLGRGREGSEGPQAARRGNWHDGRLCRSDGMFLGIGHEPNAKMFAGQIDLDAEGYVLTQGKCVYDAQGHRGSGGVRVRRCAGSAGIGRRLRLRGRDAWRRLKAEKYLEEHGH